MLAVARALVSQPQVLLLDEPSTGLSPKMVFSLYEKLVRLVETGLAMVVAEQNVASLVGLCERGLLLVNGRITRLLDREGLAEVSKDVRLLLLEDSR
jgi:branched-chain amino acid transport system ATP-binding protein